MLDIVPPALVLSRHLDLTRVAAGKAGRARNTIEHKPIGRTLPCLAAAPVGRIGPWAILAVVPRDAWAGFIWRAVPAAIRS